MTINLSKKPFCNLKKAKSEPIKDENGVSIEEMLGMTSHIKFSNAKKIVKIK